MVFPIGQVPTGVDPVQWHAWCPNDVEWHIIAMVIMGGAALITFGFSRRIRYLVDAKAISKVWELWGAVILAACCGALGALAGAAFWHWSGGALAGVTGSGGSPFVIYVLMKVLGRFFPHGGAQQPPLKSEDPEYLNWSNPPAVTKSHDAP